MPRIRPRALSRPLQRPRNGFALPIALGGSMLLLLSSGSLQLLALHNRARLAEQQRQLQVEDLLASAAQQQAAALATQANCLLAVDLAQWVAVAPGCGLGSDQLAALQQGQVGGQGYRVAAYRPAAAAATGSAELELQLTGARPWRAVFRLGLAPAAQTPGQLRVTAVQELGLRGARA
jgi:hypothetical protein